MEVVIVEGTGDVKGEAAREVVGFLFAVEGVHTNLSGGTKDFLACIAGRRGSIGLRRVSVMEDGADGRREVSGRVVDGNEELLGCIDIFILLRVVDVCVVNAGFEEVSWSDELKVIEFGFVDVMEVVTLLLSLLLTEVMIDKNFLEQLDIKSNTPNQQNRRLFISKV